jgi:hypothetical protein
MIKLIFLLRRRQDLSMDAFVERYENGHKLLGERHVPSAIRYTRRFLQPVQGIFTDADSAFDVITELWFADQAAMDAAMLYLRRPDVAAEIAADEELQFDRAATRVYVVREEHLSPGATA